jgi:hypothetical protein
MTVIVKVTRLTFFSYDFRSAYCLRLSYANDAVP